VVVAVHVVLVGGPQLDVNARRSDYRASTYLPRFVVVYGRLRGVPEVAVRGVTVPIADIGRPRLKDMLSVQILLRVTNDDVLVCPTHPEGPRRLIELPPLRGAVLIEKH
jgi:hypothetical protein